MAGSGTTDRLLSTKLAFPRPSRTLVRRPRLIEVLAGALDARLAVVSAPPGFGKTTALVDWLVAAGTRSGWIALDEGDNDPVRLLRYLRAGIGGLGRGEGSASVGEAPSPGNPSDTAMDLAEQLAAWPGPSVLVLDDYHVITDPDAQHVVERLLERLPPQAHVVIATRADPMLPLARLRARGELLEVRADVLRFTVDEARTFLTERMHLALSNEDVATLVDRTEGWPAVLLLAGLSLARNADPASGVREFAATHRFVLDYVVEEILDRLPPDTVHFLLQTSVLGRLSGPLCDAVTGQLRCQARLEALDRANLMIVPLDEERRWYRYHALFAEVLRARQLALHPDEIAGLHRRASDWHEAAGNEDEAIGHALRAGDVERAVKLVAGASLGRLNAGELSTLRRWLDALPADAVRDDAQLSASYAWCLTLAGHTAGVAGRLADAERALQANHEGGFVAEQMIRAELALLRSRLASLGGDRAAAIAEARRARSLVPAGLPPVDEATLRGDAEALLAVALAGAGDDEGARSAYLASLPDLRLGGNTFALGRAIADLAALEIRRGDPAAALRLCESELARDSEESAVATSPAVWAAVANARAELGQAELADAAARRALDLAGRAGDSPSARSAEATLARVGPLLASRTSDTNERGGQLIEPLSARELEVLRLVALGRSNAEIAGELYVTVGTVKAHVHNVSGKLGAANRTEAAAKGRQLGLLA